MLKHKNITIICISVLVMVFLLSLVYGLKWWYLAGLFLFWLVFTVWGSSDIRLGYFVKTYCRSHDERQLNIALTFDDGPHPMTEKVLDVLKKYDTKATFFCIGIQIEKHPDIFKRIVEEGHVVGNHSHTHSNRFGVFSAARVRDELEKTNAIIEQVAGKRALFFRPPFGVTNPNIAKAVAKTGHYVIGWDNRSLDTVIKEEVKILERVERRVAPGGIILLHDTSLKTVHVLEQLLLFLESKNYKAITIDKLLKLPAYEN